MNIQDFCHDMSLTTILCEFYIMATEPKECPICLESMSTITDMNYTLPCNHKFHTECVNRWKKITNTCPCCRAIFCAKTLESDRLAENDRLNPDIVRSFIDPILIHGRLGTHQFHERDLREAGPRFATLPSGNNEERLSPTYDQRLDSYLARGSGPRFTYRTDNHVSEGQRFGAMEIDALEHSNQNSLANILTGRQPTLHPRLLQSFRDEPAHPEQESELRLIHQDSNGASVFSGRQPGLHPLIRRAYRYEIDQETGRVYRDETPHSVIVSMTRQDSYEDSWVPPSVTIREEDTVRPIRSDSHESAVLPVWLQAIVSNQNNRAIRSLSHDALSNVVSGPNNGLRPEHMRETPTLNETRDVQVINRARRYRSHEQESPILQYVLDDQALVDHLSQSLRNTESNFDYGFSGGFVSAPNPQPRDSVLVQDFSTLYGSPRRSDDNTQTITSSYSELNEETIEFVMAETQCTRQIALTTLSHFNNNSFAAMFYLSVEDTDLDHPQFYSVDGSEIDNRDIELVMDQAHCSKVESIQALIDHNNDLINAIMVLTI